MLEVIKKYWDIISGAFGGLILAIIAKFELETVQLYYSIIILMLVSIGILRIVRQAVDKQREKKRKTMVDGIIDGQRPVKAIRIAQEPTKDGETIGKLIINLWEVSKKNMNKVKTFFDKFKGFMLTIALAVLTAVESCGGFINSLCNGALTINGVEVLPLVTLVCTAVVGIISNGFTKEQREKIKALFAKSNPNELVLAEIKKAVKENSTKLAQFHKILTTKETELANLQSELESAKNTHNAKKEMFAMVPQLATADDVQLAANEVVNIEAKIADKTGEIEETKKTINNLTTTLNALKSQL